MNETLTFPSEDENGAGQAAPDESRLLDSVRGGDRRAAEELAERTYRTIYASLFKLCGGDRELAADLTQETYQRAWAALAQFRGGSKFSTWLYRIAYTTFLNHVRRPTRLVPMDEKVELTVRDPGEDAESVISSGQEAARLRRAVLQLPEELRFTVSAHFWAALPVKEIASLERVTSAAIRKRLKKAFLILETSLEETRS